MALTFNVLIAILLYVPAIVTGESKDLSQSDSLVYGPGVHPKKHPLPIEYIYIQLMSTTGNKYVGPVNEGSFQIDFSSLEGERVFVHKVVHYLGEGLFVVRYRLHREVKSLTISLKYENEHLGESPYMIGTAVVDKCYCPNRSLDQWLDDFECPAHYDQINSDLAPYRKTGIKLDGLYERILKEFPNSHGIHYSIINNKIYGKTFGTITDFRYMSDLILTSLANKVSLPNMELIVQVSDWPQDRKDSRRDPFPFFSWCGSEDYRDIIWPQYDLMRHTVQAMDRVALDMIMLQSSRIIPWEERIPKGFFRGRDSNRARLDLVRLHRLNTDLFNVSLTQFFFHQHSEEMYGKMVDRVSLLEFFKYKYQLNIDGTVAAYRFPFLMGGGSLVLKQDSEYYEHFYHQLQPWVHYVPLKKDLSDVVEKLEWAKEHDEEVAIRPIKSLSQMLIREVTKFVTMTFDLLLSQAHTIAENAYRFAVDNLLPDKLYCYMFSLLKEYAKLQQGIPKIHKGMTEVTTDESKWLDSCKLCTNDATSTDFSGRDEL